MKGKSLGLIEKLLLPSQATYDREPNGASLQLEANNKEESRERSGRLHLIRKESKFIN